VKHSTYFWAEYKSGHGMESNIPFYPFLSFKIHLKRRNSIIPILPSPLIKVKKNMISREVHDKLLHTLKHEWRFFCLITQQFWHSMCALGLGCFHDIDIWNEVDIDVTSRSDYDVTFTSQNLTISLFFSWYNYSLEEYPAVHLVYWTPFCRWKVLWEIKVGG